MPDKYDLPDLTGRGGRLFVITVYDLYTPSPEKGVKSTLIVRFL